MPKLLHPVRLCTPRSLVALDNLADFIVTSMSQTHSANQPFLVSDGNDLSTTKLVRGLMRAPNVSARAILLAMEGGVQRNCGNLQVDISQAKNVLGWHPPVPVNEALRRTVVGLQTS